MNDSKIRDKAKAFAKEIIVLMREIREKTKEHVLTNQLLKSGTSIGANIHEAQYAQGRLDFISKLEIALKECYESEYWLELLFETGYIAQDEYNNLNRKCGEIRRLLVSSCATAKANI